MEDRERIVKVATNMDALSAQLNRIESELRDLRSGLEKLRDLMDHHRTEDRKEYLTIIRWLTGVTLTYGAAIVGLLVKMAVDLARR